MGADYVAVGQVAALGTKVTATNYAYPDSTASTNAGNYYYHRPQVDLKDLEAYSTALRTVAIAIPTSQLIGHPHNAARGARAQVLDMLGRAVYITTADAAALALPANIDKDLCLMCSGSQTICLLVANSTP
jgi:hypothetical protein